MNNMEEVKCNGHVFCKIEYKNGKTVEMNFPNTVVSKGREAIASVLANQVGTSGVYVQNMIFGTNGVDLSETPKVVVPSRNSLFGTTASTLGVNSGVDPTTPTLAYFSAVMGYDTAVGEGLNEMALVMNNGNLYSMVTFPTLNKTNMMQITWLWKINFV